MNLYIYSRVSLGNLEIIRDPLEYCKLVEGLKTIKKIVNLMLNTIGYYSKWCLWLLPSWNLYFSEYIIDLWEKIVTNNVSDKSLIFKIYKEL